VPNLVGDRAEGVPDGGVGIGFLPAAMAAGVLRAGAMEGGGEEVEELQGDVVKLVVSSIGVEKGREQVVHGGQGRRRVEIDGNRREASVVH
jgi:hypothetical protein